MLGIIFMLFIGWGILIWIGYHARAEINDLGSLAANNDKMRKRIRVKDVAAYKAHFLAKQFWITVIASMVTGIALISEVLIYLSFFHD